jgi:hypothetical protein
MGIGVQQQQHIVCRVRGQAQGPPRRQLRPPRAFLFCSAHFSMPFIVSDLPLLVGNYSSPISPNARRNGRRLL